MTYAQLVLLSWGGIFGHVWNLEESRGVSCDRSQGSIPTPSLKPLNGPKLPEPLKSTQGMCCSKVVLPGIMCLSSTCAARHKASICDLRADVLTTASRIDFPHGETLRSFLDVTSLSKACSWNHVAQRPGLLPGLSEQCCVFFKTTADGN